MLENCHIGQIIKADPDPKIAFTFFYSYYLSEQVRERCEIRYMEGRQIHFPGVTLCPEDVSEVQWSQQPTGLDAFIPFVGMPLRTRDTKLIAQVFTNS